MDSVRQNLEKHLRYLCFECGSRHSGSEGEKKAADYIENVYRDLGFEAVREYYPTLGWDINHFQLWNVTQNRPVPDATACYFSNPVDVEDTLLWIYPEDIEKLDTLPVNGRLCFVEYWVSDNGIPGKNVKGRNEVAEKLDECGAAAAIFISQSHTDLAPSTKIVRSLKLNRLGTAACSLRGVMDLSNHRNDVYRLIINCHKYESQSCNVIGRLKGSTRKVVIGGHYDTSPLIYGAGDNGFGTALLLEVARRYRNNSSRFSIDFCSFSGEEYANTGSAEYVKLHQNEDIAWYYNIDYGAQAIGRYSALVGHKDKLPPIVFPRPVDETRYVSDDESFFNVGIPTIWFSKRGPFEYIHTTEDMFEYINFDVAEKDAELQFEVLDQLLK